VYCVLGWYNLRIGRSAESDDVSMFWENKRLLRISCRSLSYNECSSLKHEVRVNHAKILFLQRPAGWGNKLFFSDNDAEIINGNVEAKCRGFEWYSRLCVRACVWFAVNP